MSSNKAKILLYDNDDYLKVMLERENCPSYRCNDYISYTCNSKCSYDGYVEAWRRRVAEWSFSVMDYYCLQRETASIALTFMDRYLSSIPKERMMSNYRLISICCLLIATKINEREFLSMSDINAISENKFMLKDIESMELSILKRLDWRLYPATSSLFVHLFSPFINGIPAEVMAKLLDLMNYICELASCDHFFLNHKPSTIAIAAIMHVLEHTQLEKYKNDWIAGIKGAVGDFDEDKIIYCTKRLCDIHTSSNHYENKENNEEIHVYDTNNTVKMEMNPSPLSIVEI